MFESPALSWIFSIVFLATGLYSVVRYALLTSGAERDGDRAIELSHLLMSIAMIAMAWAWTGGPGTASGILQLVVFGLFAVFFLAQAVSGGHDTVVSVDHLLMNGAMVWMVAAMPALMGMSATAGGAGGGGGGHAGHGSDSGDTAAVAGMEPMATPTWVTLVTWAFVVLLVASAVFWALRAARADTGRAVEPAAGGGGTATVVRPGLARVTNRRVDACCHLLMSLGMGGMFLAMF